MVQSRENEESRLNRKFTARRAALILLFFIAAAGGLLAGVRISLTGGEVTLAGRKIAFPTFGPKPFGGRESFTVLVLGLDQKSKFDEHSPQRSDSIMLMLVDLANKKVSGVSIPRDSRVEIPGRGRMDKINAAYAYGFAPLSIEAVKNLTGISPDYYVVADVTGFEKMVDLLGGVDLYVEKDMHYDDNWQDLHIHLKKGYQHLNGKQAMGYVRFRHDRLGDIGRIQRQQEFLKAVARRLLVVSNWPKLPQIIREARSVVVDTNMTVSELLYLAQELKGIGGENIELHILPGKPQTINGISYWIVDEEKASELIASVFGGHSELGNTTVEVLNGTGKKGLATNVAKTLERNGFRVVKVSNADSFSYTRSLIIFNPESQEGAQEIAHILGTADMKPAEGQKGASSSDIVVIVGKDYTQEGEL